MKEDSVQSTGSFLRKLKIFCTVVCVILVATGICMVIKPDTSATVISIAFGIILLAFGLVAMINFFAAKRRTFLTEMNFFIGLFSLGGGILFMFHPLWLLDLITLGIGIFVLVNGLVYFRDSIIEKTCDDKYWWVTFVVSIVCIAAGVVFIAFTREASDLLTVLSGIALIVIGGARVVTGVKSLRKDAKSFNPVNPSGPKYIDYEEADKKDDGNQ